MLKEKMGVDGKARLVAQGFSQKSGLDYDETFSPVVRMELVLLYYSPGCKGQSIASKMDVTTAFLNGTLDEEVYIKQRARNKPTRV